MSPEYRERIARELLGALRLRRAFAEAITKREAKTIAQMLTQPMIADRRKLDRYLVSLGFRPFRRTYTCGECLERHVIYEHATSRFGILVECLNWLIVPLGDDPREWLR